MASNLACVGLDVADEEAFAALVESVIPEAETLGSRRGSTVLRWEDRSGARLVVTTRRNEIVSVLPSFAGTPGARISNVEPIGDELVSIDVVEDDELATRAGIDLEQRPLLRRGVGGLASIVALGVDVRVFSDAKTFAQSDASLLGEPTDEPAPDHYAEAGLEWPPRFGAESTVRDEPAGGDDTSLLVSTEGRLSYADVVRPFAPGPGVYTYWDYTQLRFPRREGMRIDFVLGSPALAARTTGALIDREERKGKGASDHAPVVVELGE